MTWNLLKQRYKKRTVMQHLRALFKLPNLSKEEYWKY